MIIVLHPLHRLVGRCRREGPRPVAARRSPLPPWAARACVVSGTSSWSSPRMRSGGPWWIADCRPHRAFPPMLGATRGV